ncbi:MAG TPA: TylF/MycF/NovP-related O-methyltransferase [Patescibacteria group bacterium]|nr:TylF/MycF/NovP-related O-methyltransferase [Patescibacteria group bacterium]
MDDPDAFSNHAVPNTPANHFQGHLLISDQVGAGEVSVVWRELQRILTTDIPGDIVEFGCYAGTTSLFIRRLIQRSREFHVYDSFEGLPPKASQDSSAAGADFAAGKLSVSKKEFLRQFALAKLEPPVIHKGWFKNMADKDMPNEIAFAFLDGDFYDSILDSLKLVWPRMQQGGVLLIDDYNRPELPGVQRAVHDFFHGQLPKLHTEHDIAIIHV